MMNYLDKDHLIYFYFNLLIKKNINQKKIIFALYLQNSHFIKFSTRKGKRDLGEK